MHRRHAQCIMIALDIRVRRGIRLHADHVHHMRGERDAGEDDDVEEQEEVDLHILDMDRIIVVRIIDR